MTLSLLSLYLLTHVFLLLPRRHHNPIILNVRSKSGKVLGLGLIFMHFHRFLSPNTILCLYSSLVCPILEYCSLVWSPHSVSTSNFLESIQSFVLKLTSKFHSPASSLLTLPSLSSCHLQVRIKLLFAITHNFYFLPSPIVFPQAHPLYPVHSYHPFNLSLIFCWTSSFSNPSFPLLSRSGTSSPLLQNDSVLFTSLSLSILL